MSYTVGDFERRAEECARLAALASDHIVRSDLLRLRQDYLSTATRLREYGFQEQLQRN